METLSLESQLKIMMAKCDYDWGRTPTRTQKLQVQVGTEGETKNSRLIIPGGWTRIISFGEVEMCHMEKGAVWGIKTANEISVCWIRDFCVMLGKRYSNILCSHFFLLNFCSKNHPATIATVRKHSYTCWTIVEGPIPFGQRISMAVTAYQVPKTC